MLENNRDEPCSSRTAIAAWAAEDKQEKMDWEDKSEEYEEDPLKVLEMDLVLGHYLSSGEPNDPRDELLFSVGPVIPQATDEMPYKGFENALWVGPDQIRMDTLKWAGKNGKNFPKTWGSCLDDCYDEMLKSQYTTFTGQIQGMENKKVEELFVEKGTAVGVDDEENKEITSLKYGEDVLGAKIKNLLSIDVRVVVERLSAKEVQAVLEVLSKTNFSCNLKQISAPATPKATAPINVPPCKVKKTVAKIQKFKIPKVTSDLQPNNCLNIPQKTFVPFVATSSPAPTAEKTVPQIKKFKIPKITSNLQPSNCLNIPPKTFEPFVTTSSPAPTVENEKTVPQIQKFKIPKITSNLQPNNCLNIPPKTPVPFLATSSPAPTVENEKTVAQVQKFKIPKVTSDLLPNNCLNIPPKTPVPFVATSPTPKVEKTVAQVDYEDDDQDILNIFAEFDDDFGL